jgi:hypothetical protein
MRRNPPVVTPKLLDDTRKRPVQVSLVKVTDGMSAVPSVTEKALMSTLRALKVPETSKSWKKFTALLEKIAAGFWLTAMPKDPVP